MLQTHKKAMAAIKNARQRVEKATRERDKAKAKLKGSSRLDWHWRADRLKKSQEQLES